MVDQFSVDVDNLDRLGNKILPAIATTFDDALKALWTATEWITVSFDTYGNSADHDGPFTMQTGAATPNFDPYLYQTAGNECYITMDLMRQVFEDNRDNVNLAAQAIKEIAKRYRHVDGQG